MTGDAMVPDDNVNIGSDVGKPIPVRLQHLQQIFHEITGKSDNIGKRYEVNFCISAEDIIHLNEQIKQTMEQYDVKSTNCSVSIYFVDSNKQQFKSFESFALMGSSSTSCVESILIRYDFLIVPPITKIMQTFELTIRLTSRVAAQKQMRESESMPLPRILQAIIVGTTAVVQVKHVDYTIAKSLLGVADSWLTSCPHTESSKIINFFKSYSHFLPRISQYGIGAIAAVATLHELPKYLNVSSGPQQLASYLLVSSFTVFALYRLAYHLGRAIEYAVDSHFPLSYLKLTRGDEKEIKRAEKERGRNRLHGIVAFAAAVLEAALAKYVVAAAIALYSLS